MGKSTLINKLLGEKLIKTAEISERFERGKHTTTRREMFFLQDGGIVIDNPGMREVGMVDTKEGIEIFFDEISALAKECKYPDCRHVQEPGCKVLEALNSGGLDEAK
ncbi:MAG: GTPase RsgA, partial [Candidatus Nealsonbacteria bacterium]|nr:GTPase RsgA [Candidatus Nealsonbacteria bacterium]